MVILFIPLLAVVYLCAPWIISAYFVEPTDFHVTLSLPGATEWKRRVLGHTTDRATCPEDEAFAGGI